MKNTKYPLLQTIVGKTVSRVHVSDSHGEVLHVEFTDGTHVAVASTYGLALPDIKPDPHTIYMSVNHHSV